MCQWWQTIHHHIEQDRSEPDSNTRTHDPNRRPEEGLRVETSTWSSWSVFFFEGNNMWNIKQRKNQNHSSKNTAFFSSTVNVKMQKHAPPPDWRFPHLNLCCELRLIWVTNHNWRVSPNISERALPTSFTSVLLISCHIKHHTPAGCWTQAQISQHWTGFGELKVTFTQKS